MKAREQAKLSALRLLTAAIKQREVDERIEVDDALVLSIIEKLIKQRKEAAVQFEAAGRSESAEAERFEITILTAYLPQQLTEAEISALVVSAVSAVVELSAAGVSTGPQDMGKVMALLKPKLAGRADMALVSAIVKKALL